MSNSWTLVLDNTLEGDGSPRDFLCSITHWFGEDLAQEPEDSHEAIGRRTDLIALNSPAGFPGREPLLSTLPAGSTNARVPVAILRN